MPVHLAGLSSLAASKIPEALGGGKSVSMLQIYLGN
jgi:hypothetical protein